MATQARRNFIKKISCAGVGTLIPGLGSSGYNFSWSQKNDKRVGIVGMDTSHSPYLVRGINTSNSGYRVTAAYTSVSNDLPASHSRVGQFSKQIKSMGVEITDSLGELLNKVDYVLLCTVDGRLHKEQAEIILKAGKRVFIDKPMAISLVEVIEIFEFAQKLNIPIFSSSAVRFMKTAQEVRDGAIGNVTGAQVYAPIIYEPTHPSMYWYGIHGAELLYTVMGNGCEKVKCFTSEKHHFIIGDWGHGRIGTYNGLKNGMQKYGGQVFGDKGVSYLGDFENLSPLTDKILEFFETGEVPVDPSETIELFAFLDAAQKSEKTGTWVSLKEVWGQ
ncbi:Gfo/Idh/MocA family protein [Flagellimonas algicola]|uniref:Gfo/Idh/MocA family oxidoreductase n=1 Tax=Flagellimonas algicola TaxID=2583815 RepID=A0ABY2WGZ5_9FLAO|nr:Gfo/Idh/MocA family oxidoreductase [Allomuricauda algicola]TMU50714.1 Gfo/Idh/MocA family oxidoreductase [Allomuricauda algicola]